MHATRLPLLLVALIAVLACLPAAAQVTTSTIAVANDPASAAVNSANNTIFVANDCGNDPTCQSGNGSVTIINGTTLATQTVSTADYPYPIVVNSATNIAYAATCDSDTTCATGTVTVINGNTLATQNVNTGFYTDWVAVNPMTNKIFATNECNDANCTTDGTLTIIDGVTLNTQTVTTGALTWSVAVNTTTNKIYVVNQCGTDLTCSSPGTVTVIDGVTLNTQTVNVGYFPLFAAVDETHNVIYVTNEGGADGSGNPGTVTVIDGSTLSTRTVNVGNLPVPVIVNPNTNTAYVGNDCGSDYPTCVQPPSATVINGSTLSTSTVSICNMETVPAENLGINLTTNKVYFPCQGESTYETYGLSVTVLDGATNTTFPVAVGDYPNAAAVNSATNTIYVPNQVDATVSVIGGATKLQLNAVTPCRLVDTRPVYGGGGPIMGGTFQTFNLPQLAQSKCTDLDLSTAASYSLNVTLIPSSGPVGYLTIWPDSLIQPVVSTMNSDGRTKANAAIVSAGLAGAVDVYVANTANVVLDIDGYFGPSSGSTLQFYPVTPCRIADTRMSDFPPGLGAPSLQGGVARSFPLLNATTCFPSGVSPAAYSLNFTAVPHNQPLGYITVWPTGEDQPVVSTLNDHNGVNTANAAIVPAGTSGAVSVYPSANTDLLIDINGYFAAPGVGGLSLYPTAPCRVLDTRNGNGAFSGLLSPPVNPVVSPCGVPSQSQADTFNATVVPYQHLALGYLSLWPVGLSQPVVSTLNAPDGAVTSNMAIVPAGTNGEINAFAYGTTNLIMDISSFFAP